MFFSGCFFFTGELGWPHGLMLSFFSPPPSLQQSAHAKEATEQVEVAILKTCQSISELRRQVSTRLWSPSPLPGINITAAFFLFFFPRVAPQLSPAVVIPPLPSLLASLCAQSPSLFFSLPLSPVSKTFMPHGSRSLTDPVSTARTCLCCSCLHISLSL